MTDTTPRVGAPLLAAAQAQKHVTHNEALYQFDAFLCARFLDRTLTAPPGSPADGDTYLIATGGTGAWTGQDGNIAYCADGDWRFYAPFGGLVAYVFDESKLIAYTGSAWVDYSSLIALEDIPMLGVNTTADSTNKLAVQSNAILFTDQPTGSGGTGDVRTTLSKQAAGNTASFLFQDAYSGRAEVGLTGDDNFHFKVSPDGATWHDAIILTNSSGLATIAQAAIGGGTVNGTAIGSTTPSSGAFTTLSASAAATLSPASANVVLSPTGTGTVTINPAAAGTIDNVAVGATTAASGKFTTLQATSGINGSNIGATTPGTGAFTTLSASGAVTLSPASAAVAISPSGTGTVAISPAGALTINPTAASTINNCAIGATTFSSGKFSTVTAQTGNATTALFGADSTGTTLTDSTTKAARLGVPHYVNADAPMALIFAQSGSASNQLIIGGGTATMNAATTIYFYCGASTTTATGTAMGSVNSSGWALSPANANVVMSPTGTGIVTINPATAGTMDNVAVGNTTKAAGGFTTLTATGAVTLSPASAAVALSPTGSGTVAISPAGALTVNPTAASTINNCSIGQTTAAAGTFTTCQANTQVNSPIVTSNAASNVALKTSGGTQFEAAHVASAVNNLQAAGSASGAGTATLQAAGSDANIDIVLTPKGTGNVRIATVANGAVATALSSLGPTGSHATVQEWFAVKNASGTIRYIPAF